MTRVQHTGPATCTTYTLMLDGAHNTALTGNWDCTHQVPIRLVKQTLLLCCHWLLTQNWWGVARAGGGACLTGAAWAWDQCPGLSCKGKRLYLRRHGIPQAQAGGSAAEQPEWVTDVQPCISFHHPTNTWSCQRDFYYPHFRQQKLTRAASLHIEIKQGEKQSYFQSGLKRSAAEVWNNRI